MTHFSTTSSLIHYPDKEVTVAPMHLLLMKLDPHFSIKKHLALFDADTQALILSYRQKASQVTAFASALLKKYYLAAILNLNPAEFTIHYNSFGKPSLYPNPYGIEFNLSHSSDYIIMVITTGVACGIDIEQLDYSITPQELSPIIFDLDEQQLCGNDIEKFYRLWTKKEAYLKAHGYGLGQVSAELPTLTLEQKQHLPGSRIYAQMLLENLAFALCITD